MKSKQSQKAFWKHGMGVWCEVPLFILEEKKSKIQHGHILREGGVSERVRSSFVQSPTTSTRTLFQTTTPQWALHGLLTGFYSPSLHFILHFLY